MTSLACGEKKIGLQALAILPFTRSLFAVTSSFLVVQNVIVLYFNVFVISVYIVFYFIGYLPVL